MTTIDTPYVYNSMIDGVSDDNIDLFMEISRNKITQLLLQQGKLGAVVYNDISARWYCDEVLIIDITYIHDNPPNWDIKMVVPNDEGLISQLLLAITESTNDVHSQLVLNSSLVY